MKILITGNRGFVGRHFWDYFSRLDRDELHGVDIVDPERPMDVREYIRGEGDQHFDLVIHLAAVVGGRAKIEGQPLAIADNLSIDAEMFQWALRTRPDHFVYFSSSAAYPVNLQTGEYPTQLHESDISLAEPKLPDEIYGWAKLTGEIMALKAMDHGIKTHVFRPFSGYGTDQDRSYPFPAFIERAVAQEDPFTIWGNGHQARDFIHIDDIVEAVMKAIEYDIEGPINLGTGRATTFNELADLVTNAAGYKPKGFVRKLTAPKGVEYRVSDPTKMLEFYTPKISLEEGIERAVKGSL